MEQPDTIIHEWESPVIHIDAAGPEDPRSNPTNTIANYPAPPPPVDPNVIDLAGRSHDLCTWLSEMLVVTLQNTECVEGESVTVAAPSVIMFTDDEGTHYRLSMTAHAH